jgi:hypothetical protein
VGFLSRLALGDVEQVSEFPDGLAPVQVDDEGTTMAEMGRGALRVRVQVSGRDVDLVSCHLKSKLLTFPGGRFNPRDEGERGPLRRLRPLPPRRRGGHAARLRQPAARRPWPRAGGDRAGRPERRADGGHDPDPGGAAGL